MSGLESLSILVVDDNQHMRAIVSAVLTSVGIRKIREARDGAEALETLRTHQIDVVVVDFHMFPLDGVDFTRMTRNAEDSRDPYIPIIMMTGHSDRVRVEEARDAGITEFVSKPLTAKALLDRLQAIIERPRPFVRTQEFFGPDRRRRRDPDYRGPTRREADKPSEE